MNISQAKVIFDARINEALELPHVDPVKLTNEGLLLQKFRQRLVCAQLAKMLLGRGGVVTDTVLGKMMAWSDKLTPDVLFNSFLLCLDRAKDDVTLSLDSMMLVTITSYSKIEEEILENELVARLKRQPVASEMLLIDAGKRAPQTHGQGEQRRDRFMELEKLLKTDRIKSFRPWEQDDSDIRNIALTKTFELWRKKATINLESCYKELSFPLGIEMTPDEDAFWKGIILEAWAMAPRMVEETVGDLRGEKERIPGQVRNHWRNGWRELTRRAKILKGQDCFPKKGSEHWRADWDFSKAATKARGNEILGEITNGVLTPEEALQKKDLQREIEEDLERAYRIASKRVGEKKGKLFLNGLKEGKSQADAALAAGIKYRRGKRILETIRKILPKKTPGKTKR